MTSVGASMLSGCSLRPDGVGPAGVSTAAGAMHGSVFGGQQPVGQSQVQLWVAGTSYGSGATALGTSVMTSSTGNFTYGAFSCPSSSAPVYVTAAGGSADGGLNGNNSIMLAAGLGPCSGVSAMTGVNINEVTTAATAYALSHFFTTAIGKTSTDAFGGAATAAEGYNAGLVLANQYTVPLLVNLNTGNAMTTMASPRQQRTTLASAKLYHIANILAACVNSAGVMSGTDTTSNCGKLFSYTTPPGSSTRPADTLQAAVQMALYPYQNVASLYALPSSTPPFIGLSSAPNDWTLGVAYSSSLFGLGISGASGIQNTSSTIDIDASGNVWFPTNSATSHGIGEFLPSTGLFAGPYLTDLVRPQYVAIDGGGTVYGSDYSGSDILGTSVTSPSASPAVKVKAQGAGPLSFGSSSANANGGLAFAVGTTVTGSDGTTSQSTSTSQPLTSLLAAEVDGVLYFQAATSTSSNSCRLESAEAFGASGSPAYHRTVAESPAPCSSGGGSSGSDDLIITVPSANQVCSYVLGTCFSPPLAVTSPQGVALDGDGNVWVANSSNGSVSTFAVSNSNGNTTYSATSTLQYLLPGYNGQSVTPYAIAIDRSGNVWFSDAGCTTTSTTACTPGTFQLSELIGAAAPTLTPLAAGVLGNMVGRPSAITRKPPQLPAKR